MDLRIPPQSQSGSRLRLRGRGLVGDPPGDQYVVLKVVLPPAGYAGPPASSTSRCSRTGLRSARPFLGARTVQELLAETFHVALCDGRQALAGEFPRLGRVHDVLQGSGHQDPADLWISGRGSGHFVEDGEAARDLAGRGPVGLDDAGEGYCPKREYRKKSSSPDLGSVLPQRSRESFSQILRNSLKTGPRVVAIGRRFAVLHHCSRYTSEGPKQPFLGVTSGYHTSQRGAEVTALVRVMQ